MNIKLLLHAMYEGTIAILNYEYLIKIYKNIKFLLNITVVYPIGKCYMNADLPFTFDEAVGCIGKITVYILKQRWYKSGIIKYKFIEYRKIYETF
ncbi:hypothetical protein QUF74_11855 [Candidatus Halobeggiatoa sp. HSG11]|nr:hypothetical protein [Candidatus Halobeggiatoa sp. HSG11]